MTESIARWAAGLEETLGVSPRPVALFLEAFTHPSFSNEQSAPRPADNQRLEFIGDAVIALAVARELWRRFPDWREGDLARARTALVNTQALAERGRSLDLQRWLRLGRGELKSGGMHRDSTLCDAFEALVGALFLAYGWEQAENFLLDQLEEPLERLAASESPGLDPKTRLQEMLQRQGTGVPEYVLLDASGPDHRRTFAVEVRWQGVGLGAGRGTTKRAAEQAAAADGLSRLMKRGNEGTDPEGPEPSRPPGDRG